jgi:hypothetical protein
MCAANYEVFVAIMTGYFIAVTSKAQSDNDQGCSIIRKIPF